MKSLRYLIVTVFTLACCSIAFAAEQRILEEIIVKAVKRESSLQNVPVAVTAISESAIERAGVLNISNLPALASSFNMSSSQTESQGTTLRIRGVGTSGNNIGLESAVGVFIDGVYISRPGIALTEFLDVEQIEILRGPQGTLFGRNTNAGLLSISTKKPNMNRQEFFGNFSSGNFNSINSQFGASGPLIEDKLAYRISAAVREQDGFTESTTGAESHSRDRWLVRGQLFWEINDRANLRLIGDYAESKDLCCDAVIAKDSSAAALGSFAAAGLPIGGGVGISGNDAIDRRRTNSDQFENPFEQTGISAELNFELNDEVTLTYLGAWRDFETTAILDTDFVSLDVFSMRPSVAGGYETGDDIDIVSHELRFAGAHGRLNWLVGGFYSDESIVERQGLGLGSDYAAYSDANLWNFALFPLMTPAQGLRNVPLATGGTFGDVLSAASPTLALAGGVDPAGSFAQNRFQQESESWSLFTHNIFQVNERAKIVLGLRWTEEKKRGSYQQIEASNPACLNTLFNATALSDGVAGTPLQPVASGIGNMAAGYACFPFASPADTGIPLLPSTFDEEYTDGEFIYDLTGAYQITDSISGYVSYTHGFKAGGFNLDATAAVAGGSPSFNSELIDAWEVGLKSEWFDGLLRANLAAWKYYIEDFQVLEFTGIKFRTFNVPKANSDGVEFEVLSSPLAGLELSASYTYADTRYPSDCDNNEPNSPTQISAICGTEFVYSPKNVLTLGSSYDGNLGNSLSYFVSAFARWEDDRRTMSQPNPGFDIQDSNTKVHLRAGIGHGSGAWAVELWVNNVTNEQTRFANGTTPLRIGSNIAYLESPRMYGITFRTRF